ncbi:phage tail protein [Streptomyces chartreusis]|uniref:phage tail protein n=1 Tax=Streptomyces chartreusis TaxID=1969 RepID=UPI0033F83D29
MESNTNSVADPITAASFVIVFDGQAMGVFSELGGISTEITPTEYIVSGNGMTTLTKQFGQKKPPTVTLKRGVSDDSLGIWAWYQMAVQGLPAARRSGTLELRGADNTPKAIYWMDGVWPSKMDIGNLKAGSSEVVIETLTLTCESIMQMPVSGG